MHSFCRYTPSLICNAVATLHACCTCQLIDSLHSDNQPMTSDQSAHKSENSVVQLVLSEGTFVVVRILLQ